MCPAIHLSGLRTVPRSCCHRVIDINALVEKSLNLAWHGARCRDWPEADIPPWRESDDLPRIVIVVNRPGATCSDAVRANRW
jgi:hypothetical protein